MRILSSISQFMNLEKIATRINNLEIDFFFNSDIFEKKNFRTFWFIQTVPQYEWQLLRLCLKGKSLFRRRMVIKSKTCLWDSLLFREIQKFSYPASDDDKYENVQPFYLFAPQNAFRGLLRSNEWFLCGNYLTFAGFRNMKMFKGVAKDFGKIYEGKDLFSGLEKIYQHKSKLIGKQTQSKTVKVSI